MPHTLPNFESAIASREETRHIDFKVSFDSDSSEDWAELVKDIVAMANSGGGYILLGVNDSGTPALLSENDPSNVDPALFVDKIFKFTSQHFDRIKVQQTHRDGVQITVISIGRVDTPIIFTHPGSYTIPSGKTKNAFAQGTIYFRHGAKSEPGTSDDLREFLDRRLEFVRKSWLDGIARVVEAPPGSQVLVLPSTVRYVNDTSATPVHLVSDPNAPHAIAIPVDQTHPYRLTDIVKEFKKRSPSFTYLTSHYIICVRKIHKIDTNTLYCYKQRYASPLYSESFLLWLIEQSNHDSEFFIKAKAECDALKHSAT